MPSRTLDNTLREDRSRFKADRLELAIEQLHLRANGYHARRLPVPGPLRAAIHSFERELKQLRR